MHGLPVLDMSVVQLFSYGTAKTVQKPVFTK